MRTAPTPARVRTSLLVGTVGAVSEPSPWPVIRIDLDHPITSKSNYRRRPKSSEWQRHNSFKLTLSAHARAVRPPEWDVGDPESALADRPTVVLVISAVTLLDTANLSKSVADAFEGALYVNDASIRMVVSTSVRSRSPQSGTLLLAQLPARASLHEMHAAADFLLNLLND